MGGKRPHSVGVGKKFVYLQSIIAIISAVLGTGTIWMLAETINGLMAIPNLIVIAYLGSELGKLTYQYRKRI